MKASEITAGSVVRMGGSWYRYPTYIYYYPPDELIFVKSHNGGIVCGIRKKGEAFEEVTFTSRGDHTSSVEKVVKPTFARMARKWIISQGFKGRGRATGAVIGCDPEVFVLDKDERVIPAWKFLPKKDSTEFHNLGGHVHWDGWQAEFTTNAGGCLSYLGDSVQLGYCQVVHQARKAGYKNAHLSWKDVVDVDAKDLLNETREHVIMGCAPSVNAYAPFTPPVENSRMIPFRSAGFHHHISCHNIQPKQLITAVKMADRMHGTIFEVVLRGLVDPRRRQLYGRMGEYRKTEYGFEYRPPSSAIGAHPVLFNLSFDVFRQAVKLALEVGPEALDMWQGASDDMIQDIGNNNDYTQAKKLLMKNKALVLSMLSETYDDLGYWGNKASDHTGQAVWDRLILPGAKEVLDLDMHKNWLVPEGSPSSSSWKKHTESPNCQLWKWACPEEAIVEGY